MAYRRYTTSTRSRYVISIDHVSLRRRQKQWRLLVSLAALGFVQVQIIHHKKRKGSVRWIRLDVKAVHEAAYKITWGNDDSERLEEDFG